MQNGHVDTPEKHLLEMLNQSTLPKVIHITIFKQLKIFTMAPKKNCGIKNVDLLKSIRVLIAYLER